MAFIAAALKRFLSGNATALAFKLIDQLPPVRERVSSASGMPVCDASAGQDCPIHLSKSKTNANRTIGSRLAVLL